MNGQHSAIPLQSLCHSFCLQWQNSIVQIFKMINTSIANQLNLFYRKRLWISIQLQLMNSWNSNDGKKKVSHYSNHNDPLAFSLLVYSQFASAVHTVQSCIHLLLVAAYLVSGLWGSRPSQHSGGKSSLTGHCPVASHTIDSHIQS